MSWRPLGDGEPAGLVAFLCRDEASCAAFSARVKAGGRGGTVFVDADDRGIRGALLATAGGLLLPALPDGAGDRAVLAGLIADLRLPAHSVMGSELSVAAVEAAVPSRASKRIEYRLMSLARAAWPGSPAHANPGAENAGVRVRRSVAGDAAGLFPLQRAYEMEEVVINPSLFSDSACLRMLRQGLRGELMFHASLDDRPLAKAGTNARGYGVDQIGGVYTVPEERGKGLARIVVAALLEAIFREKPLACLFVKKTNLPAIALYERLGFRTIGGYAIAYFGM